MFRACCVLVMAMTSVSLAVAVAVVMAGLSPADGTVDYYCLYGPMLKTTRECVSVCVSVCECVCVCVCVSV